MAPKLTAAVKPATVAEWEDLAEFSPSMAPLRAVDEGLPVSYRLTVTRPDRPDIELGAPSVVLTHDEWVSSPAYDSQSRRLRRGEDSR